MSKEVLDSEFFDSANNLYSQTTGKVFGDVSFGISMGLVMISAAYVPFTVPFLIPAAYVLLSRRGIKLDLSRGRMMQFTRHFGFIEKGTWKENVLYKEIAIMGGTESVTGNSGVTRAGVFSTSKVYVALLDKYHHKRLEIYAAQNVKDAREVANLISEKTGFPLVNFNPGRISQKSN
ncbi:MAG: hypothetical protein ACHQF2_00120 [Flavobacteriales bacterium]